MSKYGYARVSTTDQNLSRQLDQLKKENCNKIYKEKVSGKNIEDRKELKLLLAKLKAGDTVVISSLDRLSRNYDDIKHLYNLIVNEKQCNIVILDMPILNSTPDNLISRFMNELILSVLAFVSENERQKIKERQRQGMEVARARNPYTTSLKLTESEFLFHYERVLNNQISVGNLCKELGIKSRKTFYNLKKRYIKDSDLNVKELILNKKSTSKN